MQIVDIGDAEGLVNPVLDDVNSAMIPLRANSNPAKCIADAAAINNIARILAYRTDIDCCDRDEDDDDEDLRLLLLTTMVLLLP
jgi:hypothetical protein